MNLFILISSLFLGAQAFAAQAPRPATPIAQIAQQNNDRALFLQVERNRIVKYNAEKNNNRPTITARPVVFQGWPVTQD